MLYDFAEKGGLLLCFAAALSHVALCVYARENNVASTMRDMTRQCKIFGLVFLFLAWFIGDGPYLSGPVWAPTDLARWLQIFALAWLVIYLLCLAARLWSKNDKQPNSALVTSLVCFAFAYLID